MIVRIPDQDSFKISGTNGQMVGNLDSGDYTIVSFGVTQIGRSEDSLIIQIDYTDSIGERRSILKEINFDSGLIVGNFTSEEFSESFPEGFEGMRSFPGQQKKPVWPYFLAGGLVLVLSGFFIYHKNSKKIKIFFNDFKKRGKNEISGVPDWIIKDKLKGKKVWV
jgi:hypothetical protein